MLSMFKGGNLSSQRHVDPRLLNEWYLRFKWSEEVINEAKEEIYDSETGETKLRRVKVDPIWQKVKPLLAPSIALEMTPEQQGDTTPGTSRIGGNPDLPVTLKWPSDRYIKAWKKESPNRKRYPYILRHYKFVAQINLAELASLQISAPLPQQGMLYFFTDVDEHHKKISRRPLQGAETSTEHTGRVLYYGGDVDALQRTCPPTKDYVVFDSHQITPKIVLTMPSSSSIPLRDLALSTADLETYKEIEELTSASHATHMLGFAGEVQDGFDMRIQCEAQSTQNDHQLLEYSHGEGRDLTLEKGANRWLLLLQVDSTFHGTTRNGMTFGDAGRIYFWIRDDDLKSHDFSNCQLIFQGH